MEQYKSNSYKARDKANEIVKEKKLEKVINGVAVSKKKTGVKKFADIIMPNDIEDRKRYICEEFVIPAVKDIILNTVKVYLGMSNNSGGRLTNASTVSYRKYYGDREKKTNYSDIRRPITYDFNDIIVPTRGDAEAVLMRMEECLDEYDAVSVADFYELVGISSNHTDNKYGWEHLRNASVVRVADGYKIKLPKPIPLN